MAAALLLALVSAHYTTPRNSTWVQKLREHLLTGADSFVPPDTDGIQGIEIGIQYRFFKVIKVDLASGQLVLKIWRRMRWTDPRLSWDPADWDNITQVVMYPGAHSGGAMDTIDNNMWTPQVVLYNGITPQDQVMEEGAAWVTHTGAVWSSTPGVIDVSCRFAGLAAFPFDELSCPIEIASWSYSDLVTNLTFMDDRECVDLEANNPTAGTTYAEYMLASYECEKNTITYPCCGDTPYTALQRARWAVLVEARWLSMAQGILAPAHSGPLRSKSRAVRAPLRRAPEPFKDACKATDFTAFCYSGTGRESHFEAQQFLLHTRHHSPGHAVHPALLCASERRTNSTLTSRPPLCSHSCAHLCTPGHSPRVPP